ncbi:radical SAM protein [Alkalihalobacterium alkalinitrilicum]|uniref:radical SAM protein n=1 Tax=Alkalihalobacterium alkalinitrilicum TaxID=427920 RepID=UPI001EE3A485|nr:radical SAM protein [Alkalihalobacterium alkalinitrilicum]
MSFYHQYEEMQRFPFQEIFASVTEQEVKQVLKKNHLNEKDLLILLSPTAEHFLEEMAQKAHQLTVRHNGKTMLLFTPMYISDYCVNHCTYCSFSIMQQFNRKKLSLSEIEIESKSIAATGLKHILVLTGEAPIHTPISYFKEVICILKKYFSSISIEIHPLQIEEYKELVQSGVDGLTIYQEVYNENVYKEIHIKGPKRNYNYRLDAPERGCKAGMQQVTVGALLGMDNWRKETFFSAMHANYL